MYDLHSRHLCGSADLSSFVMIILLTLCFARDLRLVLTRWLKFLNRKIAILLFKRGAKGLVICYRPTIILPPGVLVSCRYEKGVAAARCRSI